MELFKFMKEVHIWKKTKPIRIRAAIILCEFLGIMLALTLVSKGVYQSRLPQVTVVKGESKSLTHVLEADGIVQQETEHAVISFSGLLVSEIYAKEGDLIEKGNPLFQVDIEDLKEQITAKEIEINKLQLQMKEAEENRNKKAQERALKTARALQDYGTTQAGANQDINDAAADLERIKAKQCELGGMDSYVNRVEENDETLKQYREEVSTKERELEDLKKQLTAVDLTVSENVVTADGLRASITQKEKEWNTAKETRDSYRDNLLSSAKSTWETSNSAYNDQIATQQKVYDQAVRDKETEMITAARGVEDANMPELSDYTLEGYQLEVKRKEQQLEKYKQLIEKNGLINSDQSGTVTSVMLSPGTRTPDGAAFLVAEGGEQLTFSTNISKDWLKYLAIGDSGEIKLYGKNQVIQDAIISELKESKDNPELYQVQVTLPAKSASIGDTGVLQMQRQSESFAACLPLEALRSEESRYYVWVLREQESFLGKEWTAVKRFVTVLDKNDKDCAIESGVITADEQVIVETTKELKVGSVVRL